MAMAQFDILGALKTAAEAKGYKFLYGIDRFYRNEGAAQEFTNGELILIADFRVDPTFNSGAKFSTLRYTCLLMLGRKFDADGQAASLDETSQQKYDRRILELMSALGAFIVDFKCANELEAISAPMEPFINAFDTNIDFAMSTRAIFDQV